MENLNKEMEIRDAVTDLVDLIDLTKMSNKSKLDCIQAAIDRLNDLKEELNG